MKLFLAIAGIALILSFSAFMKTNEPPVMAMPAGDSTKVFTVSATEGYVNVMGKSMPAFPSFVVLKKKPGKVRGYVKTLAGQPIKGAYIGVRASAIGGHYSGASVETDASGYYELAVPYGAAHFYATGFTMDYGEGRAAVALHAADGKAGSFASAEGDVENFVLLPYGIADPDGMSEKPFNPNNYYGGSIRISYDMAASEDDKWASKGSLIENSEIEITLTAVDEIQYPAAPRTFIIRKKTGNMNFYINNLPVAKYSIKAKLKNGKELKMASRGYDAIPLFGLTPREATGSAMVWFNPGGAKPLSATPNRGNWTPVGIKLELP